MLTKAREITALGLKPVRYEYGDVDAGHTWQEVRVV